MVSANDRELTSETLDRYRAIGSLIDSHSDQTNSDVDLHNWVCNKPKSEHHKPERGFTREVKLLNFSFLTLSIDLQELFHGARSILALALMMPVIYGGIHLSAWNFEFPTVLENLLWKIAGIGIATTLPVLYALGVGMETVLAIVRKTVQVVFCRDQLRSEWRGVAQRINSYMGYVAIIFYTLARAYIVVESFVSLRRVPIGVYWTPAWLQMIPHV